MLQAEDTAGGHQDEHGRRRGSKHSAKRSEGLAVNGHRRLLGVRKTSSR
jgi:hypothetical protein